MYHSQSVGNVGNLDTSLTRLIECTLGITTSHQLKREDIGLVMETKLYKGH